MIENIRIFGKYGSPVYYFDEDYIEDRVAYLRKLLPENTNICYAVKANAFISESAAAVCDRIEVCSPGEYRGLRRLGIKPEMMVISGVYKTPNFMREMIADVKDAPIYTAESITQARLLQEIAAKEKLRLRVLLRLTSKNQFGMKKADIRSIFEGDYSNLDIIGLHYFSGTQKHSLKAVAKELGRVKKFIDELEESYGIKINELEYGGGFPVYYFGEEFCEDAFLQEFTEIYEKTGIDSRLTIELGRSIAAGCGFYKTQIVDIKDDGLLKYVIVDGGIHQMAYYGQTMGMKIPEVVHLPGDTFLKKDDDICLSTCSLKNDNEEVGLADNTTDDLEDCLANNTSDGLEEYVICGSLCTINDILVKQLPLKNPRIGDYLIFKNTGAYSVTEGISLFLTRELPGVVLFSKEHDKEKMVREITETDFLNMPN